LNNILFLFMINSSPLSSPEILNLQLQQLRLSRMLQHLPSLEQQAIQHGWSYTQFLSSLCDFELSHRLDARLHRLLLESQLPNGKTFTSFDFTHCPSLQPAS
jgi:DNA replication protein DnaC